MSGTVVEPPATTTAATITHPRFLGSGFIDNQLPSLNRLPIQFLNRLLNINACGQFNKRKATRHTRIHIADQLDALYLILRSLKKLFQASLSGGSR
jgi:hypothetical protein